MTEPAKPSVSNSTSSAAAAANASEEGDRTASWAALAREMGETEPEAPTTNKPAPTEEEEAGKPPETEEPKKPEPKKGRRPSASERAAYARSKRVEKEAEAARKEAAELKERLTKLEKEKGEELARAKANPARWLKEQGVDPKDASASFLDILTPERAIEEHEQALRAAKAELEAVREELKQLKEPKPLTEEQQQEILAREKKTTEARVSRALRRINKEIYPFLAAQDGETVQQAAWQYQLRVAEAEGRVPDLDEMFDDFEAELARLDDEEKKKAIAVAEKLGYTKPSAPNPNTSSKGPKAAASPLRQAADSPDAEDDDPLERAVQAFRRAGS